MFKRFPNIVFNASQAFEKRSEPSHCGVYYQFSGIVVAQEAKKSWI